MTTIKTVHLPVGQTLKKTKDHLYWLDWLRFIAALMVVATHARGGNWVAWGHMNEASRSKIIAAFFALTRTGAEWVTVFFVLSGFLVGGKVLEKVTKGTFLAREYTIDRVSRIWVPLIPALLWSALVAYLVGLPLSMRDFIGSVLGLQTVLCGIFGGNIPLWSLAFEIWFYMLAGCAAVVMTPGGSRKRITAFLGLALSLAMFIRLEPVFLFCWLLGAFSYAFRSLERVGSLPFLGGLLLMAGYMFSQLGSDTVSVNITALTRFIPPRDLSILILSLGLALLFPWLIRLRTTSNFAASLEHWGMRLAAFSYTLYLTHYPVLALWDHFGPARYDTINVVSLLGYGGKIVSCLFLAWLLYLPFEAQTARVRTWLRLRSSRILTPFA
jgi:peptidoglycan/LPS O-acetylase OafA/YrhL